MKAPSRIINSLSQWNKGAGISVSDWITSIGNYDHFVVYSRLIWPEFIEFQNRIYIADFFKEEQLERNIENCKSAYEAQCFQNCIDVADIFNSDQENYDEETVLYLAYTLKATWDAGLKLKYPDREFNVFIDNCLDEENVGDLLVSFGEKNA